MQTNNIIILADERFSALKKNKLINTKFTAKSKKKIDTRLATNLQRIYFNSKRQYNVAPPERVRQENQVNRRRYARYSAKIYRITST
jgi:hypothetical protein